MVSLCRKLLLLKMITYCTFSIQYTIIKNNQMASLNDTISISFGLVGIISYAIGLLNIANVMTFLIYLGLVFKTTLWMIYNGNTSLPGYSLIQSNPFWSLLEIIVNPRWYLPTFAVAIFLYMCFISPYFTI